MGRAVISVLGYMLGTTPAHDDVPCLVNVDADILAAGELACLGTRAERGGNPDQLRQRSGRPFG